MGSPLEKVEDRIDLWFYIWGMLAWTTIGQLLFSEKLNSRPPHPLRSISLYYDLKCDKEVSVDADRDESCYVKFDELSEYLGKIKDAFNIAIPLPQLLFPKEETVDTVKVAQKQVSLTPEDFIKSLRVWRENDIEVIIQEPQKQPKSYEFGLFNYRSSKAKGWKILHGIIDYPNHVYRTPDDASRKLLERLNYKLVSFISKHFNLSLPNNFKLYERCNNVDKTGTYRFKFQIKDEREGVDKSIDKNMSKVMGIIEQAAYTLKTLEPFEIGKRLKIIQEIHPYLEKAHQNGWVTKEEFEDMSRPDDELIYEEDSQ
ncbi:hypothetical protein PITCH_A1930003 [uncultured Desulfobacterium sp.]|uniref:Uncharacterized protein n=1 Tax=uncultured Desulfobacterium sp. TaxID=201089 RepID=A0A445MWA6_9BACT|nr:hypothetical protein PITCH_A1930003 [uncultured Desulfobacterium sp.]